MKPIIIFIFIFCLVNTAGAWSVGDIQWADAVSVTVYKDNMVTVGNYSVKAVQFSGPVLGIKDIGGNWVPDENVYPSVIIEVYRDGKLIGNVGMNMQSEPYIDPDYEVKISATSFPDKNAKDWIYQFYNPWVTLDVQVRAVPKLELSVSTDKTEYNSNEDNEIITTVSIANTGQGFAKNVDVNLDIGGLQTRSSDLSQLHQYYSRLEKGESQSFVVKLWVPSLIEQQTYYLNGTAKGEDTKELTYVDSESTSISVLPKQNQVTIYKSVKDYMYISETETIRLSVVNGGIYDISDIKVRDTMDENFELVNDTVLSWNISKLTPGADWSASYTIRPKRVNVDGFTIPSASLEFTANNKVYDITSAQPVIAVNGPLIKVEKSVDKMNTTLGDYINVVISVNNIGDIATKVDIQDYLADGISLTNGSLYLDSAYLEPSSSATLSYTVRVDTDKEIVLPSAKINFTDIKRIGAVKSVLYSNSLNINEKPLEVATTRETPPEVQSVPIPLTSAPNFDFLFVTATLLILLDIYLLVTYLKKRRK
jgi:uncharacterized repeat protein (TIGR01451 family)